MTDSVFPLTRRHLLAGLGTAILGPAIPSSATAQARTALMLQAKPGAAALRPGQPDTQVWSLLTPTPGIDMRFKRGDQLDIMLGNDLPIPVALNWHGIDGAPAAEPLTARPPLASAAKDSFAMPLRHAGTFLCDLRLLGDGQERPLPARVIVVEEREKVGADRDEVVLIEDWRLRPDGRALAPGIAPQDATPLFTVNGQASIKISARTNERLRIRFINSCQRSAIAVKIEDHDMQVMAIDSQPSEPFLARNGQLVMAPGTRIEPLSMPRGRRLDVIHPPARWRRAPPDRSADLFHQAPVRDATLPAAAPLPPTAAGATRSQERVARRLTLGGAPSDWMTPVNFPAASAPAFRTNPAARWCWR